MGLRVESNLGGENNKNERPKQRSPMAFFVQTIRLPKKLAHGLMEEYRSAQATISTHRILHDSLFI